MQIYFGDLAGPVLRGVVAEPEPRTRHRLRKGIEGVTDAVGLVSGRRDHDALRGVFRRHWRILCPAMADIEAHITGTVWKIEVNVGDEVSDGDTVVILESMKMEMPVEAEDDGVVKEIKCEEGQSVSEGDVLVVLE